jgi:Uma2 family endonuclease
METLTLDVSALAPLTDEALYRLCASNRELRIERTREGELILMPPAGGESSRRNGLIVAALAGWNQPHGTGVVFDSSGGFLLPSRAMRSPDAAWVARERWKRLSAEERRRFPPLCPDVVVEPMSETDRLHPLQAKMEEWIENGCRLAWLIDPEGSAPTSIARVRRRGRSRSPASSTARRCCRDSGCRWRSCERGRGRGTGGNRRGLSGSLAKFFVYAARGIKTDP